MSEMKKWAVLSSAVLVALSASYASAAATVYGAPGYTTAGGYRAGTGSVASNPGLSAASAGGNGLAIASETLFTGGTNATATVNNAIVINPLAAGGFTVLNQVPGVPGAMPRQTAAYSAVALNPTATLIAGTARVQTTPPVTTTGATVWTPDGTVYVLPLPAYDAGVPNTAPANATARAINDAGTVVGSAAYYTAAGQQTSSSGYAYYNDGTATTPSYTAPAVRLAPLGLSNANATNNQSSLANGLSAAGVAAGQSSLSPSNTVATFWNVGNTGTGATTIVGNQLSIVAPAGFSTVRADTGAGASSGVDAISASGVAGGSVTLYPTGSSTGDSQPIRWTPAVAGVLTTSTPGQFLSLPGGYTSGGVNTVNNVGDAIGTVSGGTINTVNVQSAVLWKAGTASPTSLKAVASPVVNPGIGSSAIPAVPSYTPKGINDNGLVVGFATNSANSTTPIDAVLWDANGNVTELNSLVALTPQTGTSSQVVAGTTYAALPTYGAAGWVTLVGAFSITNDNWVSGLGIYYDPAAFGYTSTGNPAPMSTYGNGTYYRAFLVQVPEPASLAAVSLAACAFGGRRRRQTRGA